MRRHLMIYAFCFSLFAALFLIGCGSRVEEHFEDADEIDAVTGQDLELTLKLMPDGASAGDLEWTIEQGDGVLSYKGLNGRSAVYHADKAGYTKVMARGNMNGEYYSKIFNIYVFPESGIGFTKGEYYCMGGTETVIALTYDGIDDAGAYSLEDKVRLTIEPDMQGKMEFMSSSDGPLARRLRIINKDGDSPDEFVIKADCGVSQDEARIYICHRNDPVQVALYYAKNLEYPAIEGNAVTLERFDASFDGTFDSEYVTRMGRAPKGKYAVCSGEFADGSAYFKCGLMSQLPEDLRPGSLEEVEYLIRYRPGEPVYVTDYFVEGTGEKVPAYQKAVDIVIVNAATGETIDTITTLYGGKEFSPEMEVWEGTKSVFGSDVESSEINKVIIAEIAKLWEAEGYNVKIVSE